MNKFINPCATAKNFQDLGTFEDNTGYYELYCFDEPTLKHLAIGALGRVATWLAVSMKTHLVSVK